MLTRSQRTALVAPARGPRSVVGVLPDGTVFYVPRGLVRAGPEGICCHLCGFWFPALVPHLTNDHAWTRHRYVVAFGLERGARLEVAPSGPRGAGQPRDAAPVRRGQGRPGVGRPDELLRKAAQVAAQVAARFGAADVGEFVRCGVRSGLSLAELSRRAGLSDRWLDRHLDEVSPATADWVRAVRTGGDPLGRSVAQRWLVGVAALGFEHPADYLRERRAAGWSWERIAYEGGVSRSWLLERRDRIEALFDPVLGPVVRR